MTQAIQDYLYEYFDLAEVGDTVRSVHAKGSVDVMIYSENEGTITTTVETLDPGDSITISDDTVLVFIGNDEVE